MNNNTHCQGGTMQNIFSQYGSSAQAPAPSVKTIIRDALAATKKEQKPHKILARWYKTLKKPVRLYT
jgi:hypothetical protein